MNLRPRQRQPFSGFTKAEIQSWFQKEQQNRPKQTSLGAAEKFPVAPETLTQNKTTENLKMPEGEKGEDISGLEFEARSSKDGAWSELSQTLSFVPMNHQALMALLSLKCNTKRRVKPDFIGLISIELYDVDTFLSHRFLRSGDIEVYVRYVGFGAEEDEWVNVRNDVRERSVAFEHSECQKVKAGDLVVCFQERQDLARYYDAHVIDIQRRLHDIRGCRCLFLIRYDHDNTQERVPLRRLCCRPNMLARLENN
ncbi:protein SAWADEE HOMEODOMAIN2 [Sesamum angolense]|uniref:Protein SAWADEE HOMEODOMAIN2 n=1 Tax=Sesamum angolense TaxID=2727404 RepID=A0AAE1WXP8_9LAMI|nr:protein SAWADEE HOMEODOMAIN2 [Sesamum angolense]